MVNGKCPDHQTPPAFIKEENYFFRMSSYQDWLLGYIERLPRLDPARAVPERSPGLLAGAPGRPVHLPAQAAACTWGITLPFDERYVTYVWFDALLNYLTGLGYPGRDLDYPRYWPSVQHLIAKDILKPHAIYWPTMLRPPGLDPFRQLNVHGYWQMDAGKMSKSLGNVVEPLALAALLRRGPGALLLPPGDGLRPGRHTSARRPSSPASTPTWPTTWATSLPAAWAWPSSTARGWSRPRGTPRPGRVEVQSWPGETAAAIFSGIFPALEFPRALAKRLGVRSATSTATSWPPPPGSWPRTPPPQPRLDTVLYNLLESLRWLAVLLRPVMPGSTLLMAERLGLTAPGWDSPLTEVLQWGGLTPKTALSQGKNLFPRLE